MSRLDQHIATVQNKLTLGLFVKALAWVALGYAVLVWAVIFAERVLNRSLPHVWIFFLVGCGVTLAMALGYSLWRRPNQKVTAVAIDEALGLKEKFSTALYVRPMKDPFAMAAVKDAEREADNVSLYKRFPVAFPKQAGALGIIVVLAFLTGQFMPVLHLFAVPPVVPPPEPVSPIPGASESFVKEQLPKIEAAMNPMNNNSDAIKLALDQLKNVGKTNEGDLNRSKRSALQALEQMKKALTEEMANNEKFQTSQEDQSRLSQMEDAKDDSTPLGKAQNEIKAGDLDNAVKDIGKAVAKFEQQKPEDQQKTIDQAKELANQLAKVANDPKMQQKMQQQLQQMGASQAQAQQMASAMQQAAQGNPQAAKQLQQMAQQAVQKMNNGQGPTAQQQQQIQKMMSQMQATANSQAQAQAMSQSASQMAAAMQKAAAQGQQSPGQQSKPGQQGQMAQSQQQLQQQLQNMQAQAKDAQAMKAGADAAAQAAADAAAGMGQPGQGADGQGNSPSGKGQAESQAGKDPGGSGDGDGKGQNQGQGGKGKGGAKMGIAEAPFNTTPEMDPSKDIDSGKILASRYVKAGVDPGQSKAGLKDVAASAEKDEPDEIEPDHLPRDAQKAVKDYFTEIQKADGE